MQGVVGVVGMVAVLDGTGDDEAWASSTTSAAVNDKHEEALNVYDHPPEAVLPMAVAGIVIVVDGPSSAEETASVVGSEAWTLSVGGCRPMLAIAVVSVEASFTFWTTGDGGRQWKSAPH